MRGDRCLIPVVVGHSASAPSAASRSAASAASAPVHLVAGDAAAPDHAAVAEVEGLVAGEDAAEAEAALVLVALVPAEVRDWNGSGIVFISVLCAVHADCQVSSARQFGHLQSIFSRFY